MYAFNNPKMCEFIDMTIIAADDKYQVIGLNADFVGVEMGKFDFVLDAYACCLQYGFDINYFLVDVDAFTTRQVPFNFD